MTLCNVRKRENFTLVSVTHPKYVEINESFEISFIIKNLNWLFPGDYIAYLYKNGQQLFKDNKWLGAGNSVEYTQPFMLTEPGIHTFHLSVVDDKLLKDECEDYKKFTITVLKPGESKTTQQIFDYWYVGVLGLLVIAYLWSK